MAAIIRLTRHEATDQQAQELRRIWHSQFGHAGDSDPEIATINETLPTDGRQVVARFDELADGANLVEAVLPIGLLQAVVERSQFVRGGGIILRAIMERTLDGSGGATFSFVGYERIVRVLVETQRL